MLGKAKILNLDISSAEVQFLRFFFFSLVVQKKIVPACALGAILQAHQLVALKEGIPMGVVEE